ncbi:MAG: DUF1624 domain-containing protein [Clostridia bacterium]|nr:DUF1624 domain-containing protein [Clostridia bacterium]
MENENQTKAPKVRATPLTRTIGGRIKNFFTYNPLDKRPRVWELDLLRGLLILAVTVDHFFMFLDQWKLLPFQTEIGQQIMDFAYLYRNSSFRSAMQPFALFTFCFLAGLNCRFTRSNFRRVLKFWIFCALFMGGFALLKLIFPDMLEVYLIFNIITVLTISFTIWWLLDLIKCPTWIRSVIGTVLIVIGMVCYYKHFAEPEDFYVQNEFLALMVYNEHGLEMSINNFEPLLPHLGWFLIGGVIGKFAYPENKTHCKQIYPPKLLRPLLLIGKHSLFFFLVGPVIVFVPAWIIVKIVGLFL